MQVSYSQQRLVYGMQTIAQTQVHGLFGSSTGGAGNTVAAINPVKRTKEAKNFFIRFSFTQLSIPIFMVTKVVNLNTDPYDVYIGRGSIWGNPFSHLKISKAKYHVKNRKEAVFSYKQYLLTNKELLEQLPNLVGKRLGCYCHPELCHGHIIVQVMEEKGLI